ncbi:thioredoxin domain-containing 17-like [Brachionus plicatilis]|uniref:Thioredoxin domain-containing protein 17 n=1 Tax=Brachionus plicatilis TaxID=10195 RepID=A0A3M7QFR1_BRAPC|nr:thioredoxin domain-containing 17-like [Brachionus plicatilis]
MAKQSVFYSLKELKTYLNSIESVNRSIFILFTGNKDLPNEQSWCPDCNVADPVVKKCLEFLSEDSEFITCFVGDRPTWKNPQNEFRTDRDIQLKCIPTLVQWKKNKVLKEDQCADEALVQMLFEG